MNVLNRDRISELVQHRSPLSVSLFMPTHRAGRARPQDGSRFKNLLRDAGGALGDAGASAATADDVLAPARDLRSDDTFWRHRGDGLACFCAPGFFRCYRVPINLEEQMRVDGRFHIRPLLPLLRSDTRLYILALTQESARLFESTKYSLREVPLPEIAELEVDGDEQALQYHSHKAPSQGTGQTSEALYHGQGGPSDRVKTDAVRYFQLVDRAVGRVLRGQREPLVLACVGYLAPLYDTANTYQHLVRGKVPGNPDRWSEDELREHAWKIAEPHFQETQRRAWERYQTSESSGRACDDLRRVVLAADEGRIETLFLVRGEQRWGHVDAKLKAVHVGDKASAGEELLDYAAARTLSNGGDVYLLDTLPESDSPAAATLRY